MLLDHQISTSRLLRFDDGFVRRLIPVLLDAGDETLFLQVRSQVFEQQIVDRLARADQQMQLRQRRAGDQASALAFIGRGPTGALV
ncbi:hypothetical protein J3P77_15215 [Pseudomonas sp. R1-18]|uniref:hypothetical protein n=1 Tax=Pseudomonas sp. R1-18 TaxID=1632772 RepID=UPI003DA9E9E0